MGQKNSLSQLFPLIHSLSLLHEVPLLTQQLINSLLHWPVQQSNTPSKRKSEATLSPPGRSLTLNLSGWLFDFFLISFCLSLISPWFINNYSVVKKQLINCSQKTKLSKKAISFAVYLIFFCMASAGKPNAADRQAGGQAGSPFPLPSPASWRVAAGQLHCSMSSENLDTSVHPTPFQRCQLTLHLVVFEFSQGSQRCFCLGLYVLSPL